MRLSTERPVIFLAFANDRDDREAYLRELPGERRAIQEALKEAEIRGLCELEVRSNVTLKEIFDVFQESHLRDRIAVFHYGGHANSYKLLLETLEGKAEAVDAKGLAGFLGRQRNLKLVFLNGCSTKQQVDELEKEKIPTVIATSQAIEDDVARTFASRFYKGLAEKHSLSDAFEAARDEVRSLKPEPDDTLRGSREIGVEDVRSDDGYPWEFHASPVSAGAWRLERLLIVPKNALRALIPVLLVGLFFLYRLLFPAPTLMTGDFNIALAKLGPQPDGTWLAERAERFLKVLLSDAESDIEVRRDEVSFASEGASDKAQAYARKINADVLLYAHFAPEPAGFSLSPQFNVSPQLVGVKELSGETAFGTPITFPADIVESSPNRERAIDTLERRLVPRLHAFALFMRGVAAFKAELYSKAYARFLQANSVPDWPEEEGKEVLYLWLGATLDLLLERGETPPDTALCPVSEAAPAANDPLRVLTGTRACIRDLYAHALALNPEFKRVYLARGNLLFRLTKQHPDCRLFSFAKAEYEQVISDADTLEPTILSAKAHYDIGVSESNALWKSCSDVSEADAVTHLNRALELFNRYPDDPSLQEVGARSYFQLGLVRLEAGEDELAEEAFQKAAEVPNAPADVIRQSGARLEKLEGE